jgi:hypothetical protein
MEYPNVTERFELNGDVVIEWEVEDDFRILRFKLTWDSVEE